MKPKKFIALTSIIHNQKLVSLVTSAGVSFSSESGITPIDAFDFFYLLFEKFKHNNEKETIIFVNYAFQIDNEFLFSTLETDNKDRLFQAQNIKKELLKIENEKQDIIKHLFTGTIEEKRQAKFDNAINRLSESELKEIQINDYKISLINGKILTITKNKHAISIYDIYGFFRKPLYDAVNEWLKLDIKLLDKKQFQPETLEEKRIFASLECEYIAKLAGELNTELNKVNINLSHFHGTGAIASKMLSKLKAKSEFKNYKYSAYVSPELDKATKQAFYGGRAEQFKIGTLTDVNVYDINSAYAYAASFLPVMKDKPRFFSEWQPSLFSVWFAEYDFRENDYYLGLLPNRDYGRGFTVYKQAGKGYFWQPEIAFMLKTFPENIRIKGGFVWHYKQANFAKGIEILYKMRVELKKNKHPLADVIKLALSSIYGKFCQHQGRGQFYNLRYAGFITSLVRTLLLEAVKGKEKETICFLTDAIHTTAKLDIPVNNELGSYKLKTYEQGRYIDAGIYQLKDINGKVKTAKRGFKNLDFDFAFSQISDKRIYNALMEFFTGHNLHNFLPVRYQNYLEVDKMNKQSNPFETALRLFDVTGINLQNNYTESKAIPYYSGIESGKYREADYKETDFAFDALRANKI